MAKLKLVGLWLLQILLAFLFFNIGRQKFTNPVWVRSFRDWGYPEHFYAVVGAVELLGSLLLLVPRIASYAAGAVILVMLGAFGHHVWRGEWQRATSPLVFIVLLSIVAYARRPQFLRRDQRAPAPIEPPA